MVFTDWYHIFIRYCMRMKYTKYLFLFLLTLVTVLLKAQTVMENNPPSIKWFKINSPHFNILFPKGFEEQAQRMANTLEHIRETEAKSLGSTPRKISVVLQNQSSLSNGFVSILPRRSEFYTMPPQNYNFIGTNDWLNLLAAHEYRHIVQYQHATRGFNRVLYYLFGNATLAGMSQAAAPSWFWEGDAVATETAFTSSGRGRIPNFNLVFRTNLLEGRSFNYHKQYLRSYKHYIPDHYVLGYNMVSYLRERTNDPNIWGKISARSWSVPFLPFAFSNAIKNKADLYVTDLYKQMSSDLTAAWKAQLDSLEITQYDTLTKRNSNRYTDYLYPQPLKDGSVLAMKQGIGDIEQFVVLRDGKEEKFFVPGFVNDAGMLSTAYQAVVWTEYGFDPRWRVRNYSLIKVFDQESNKQRVVGDKHSRYSAAALSPLGDKIVAVRTDQNYQHRVVIIELFTGKEIFTFENPQNDFYSMPRWSNDGKKIVALKTTAKGKSVVLLNSDGSTEQELIPVSQDNIGYPVLNDNWLLFNSPASGIDNVYAYNIQTSKRYQVTCSKYGAYNPAISADGKFIYYNEQGRDGMDVAKIAFEPASWKLFSLPIQPKTFFQHLVEQEGRPDLFQTVPQQTYNIKRHSKASGFINPYSWGLLIGNDLTTINAAITSEDVLSNIALSVGYVYDLNEKTDFWQAGISYQGWYPIINGRVSTGERETTDNAFGNTSTFTWNEKNAEGEVSIPLRFTHSKYNQLVTINGGVGLTKTTSFNNVIKDENDDVIYEGNDRFVPVNDTLVFMYSDQLNDGTLSYTHFSLSADNLLKTSYRDFLYRWGQSLDIDLYSSLASSDFKGQQLAVRGVLYFPGLARHHYLYFRGAYQKNLQDFELNTYTFRNRIPKPRGHSYPSDEAFYSFSTNYALPIWYPDIAIGPLLNVQRVKCNLFYDYGKGTGKYYYYHTSKNEVYFSTTDAIYQSVGIETTFDFNVMRFLPKFEVGFRATYLLANKYTNAGNVFEIIMGNIGF